MQKYNLYIKNINDESEKNLISSNNIKNIDAFTTQFENSNEVLKYFNFLGNNPNLKLVMYSGGQIIPIMYSKHLSYIKNLDTLRNSFASKNNNHAFLRELIGFYENDVNLKVYIKRIKAAAKHIDKYSFELIPIYEFSYLNNLDYIFKKRADISNKQIMLINIENEYMNIEKNLFEIFNRAIYDGDRVNYTNLRNICLITCKYDIKEMKKSREYIKSK